MIKQPSFYMLKYVFWLNIKKGHFVLTSEDKMKYLLSMKKITLQDNFICSKIEYLQGDGFTLKQKKTYRSSTSMCKKRT